MRLYIKFREVFRSTDSPGYKDTLKLHPRATGWSLSLSQYEGEQCGGLTGNGVLFYAIMGHVWLVKVRWGKQGGNGYNEVGIRDAWK